MISKLLPETINNEYRGQKIALLFLWPLTALLIWRSQHHMLAPDGGAQSIGSIPLDQWSDGASQTVIAIFALWGLSQLIIALMQLIVLLRYKSLVPFIYLVLIVEQAGRLFIFNWKPTVTAGTAPAGMIAVPLMIIILVMFGLSLWQRNGEES
jgi:hypothetical protein